MRWPGPLRRGALLLVLWGGPAQAASPDLLLEVKFEQHLLSEAIGAYQQGDEVLLPLGEVAHLLTIAISVSPADCQASGYILDQARGFHFDGQSRSVLRGETRTSVAPGLLRCEDDDIYIASSLLASWLPLDLGIDLANLSLQVKAREPLPLQARFARMDRQLPGAVAAAPSYPRVNTPYDLASAPFIDQTISMEAERTPAQKRSRTTIISYLTADLGGAEAALYVNSAQRTRWTLGRQDPDANLLGPLHARTVQVGSVVLPGVPNVALGSAGGNGLLVSNRGLGQPMQFDRHQFQGDLAPGWDVELYFNEALIGVQQARPDGRYQFDDLPLVYGANEFRLVFHGPLGQLHIERHSFMIDQSRLAPGELAYSVALQRDDGGRGHTLLQTDAGISKQLSASAGVLRVGDGATARNYANVGLHAYFDHLVVDAAAVRVDTGGILTQLGVRTRLGPFAYAASRAWARDFVSDFYQDLRLRDEVRIDGVPAGMPVSVLARSERLTSGAARRELALRLAAYRWGTALSHALHWQSGVGPAQADGMLQASRRVAGIGMSAQMQYAIRPNACLSALTLAADKFLDNGYVANVGVTRSFTDRQRRITAALNKNLGRFGMGINGFVAERGGWGVGVQLFVAAGREPRRGRWQSDAAPMAGTGSASLRAFLDTNRNGVLDAGETPLANVGFLVNGAPQIVRTDGDGVAWLGRLPPSQEAAIAIDPNTLEDPQWQALQAGVRIVPRAGKVSEVDFAIGMVGEIDGVTFRLEKGKKRPASQLQLQLVDVANKVVTSASSGADGYFLMTAIAPGRYQLRVAPEQLARLRLRALPRQLEIPADGGLLNGQDVTVEESE
ncbi:MAG: hypothetical protein ACJ8GW_05725 [Massilia sp.]